MPRAIFVHDGAAWRKARNLWVHDGAAWRKATRLHVHDGAAWRESGTSAPVNFSPGQVDVDAYGPSASSVYANFGSDGTITLYSSSEGTRYAYWFDAPEASAGNSYWIRASVQSGAKPSSGNALDQWLSLSGSPTWHYNSGSSGAVSQRSGTLSFQIASDAGGGNIVCSGTIGFRAYREA